MTTKKAVLLTTQGSKLQKLSEAKGGDKILQQILQVNNATPPYYSCFFLIVALTLYSSSSLLHD